MSRPLFREIYSKKVGALKVFLFTVTFSLVSIQILSTRPLQDDYFLLGALADSSWFNIMKNTWEWQGGNLWPYGAQAIIVQNSVYSNNFTVIALWTDDDDKDMDGNDDIEDEEEDNAEDKDEKEIDK
jgi:hypothetical protein